MDILSLIVGAVICIIFTEFYYFLRKKRKILISKHKIEKLEKNYNNKTILITSNGFPHYEYHNIETRVTHKKLIFCFPKEKIAGLSRMLQNGFSDRTESYLGFNSLKELGDFLKVDNFSILVEEARIHVAENFISRDKGEYFNGKMYGILKSDDYSRTSDRTENKILHINHYETDYYTHKVVHYIQQKLNSEDFFPIITINNLNSCYFPFRTSFGLSLIVEIPSTNQVLMVKRSINASYSNGKEWIYVSVTEALTDTDYDEFASGINILTWVQRGLLEELGLTTQYDISSLKIYDMFFEKSFFQDNITASIKLRDNISFESIKTLKGKDTELEISEKFVLDIGNIEDFIASNHSNMREQTIFTLRSFLSRV